MPVPLVRLRVRPRLRIDKADFEKPTQPMRAQWPSISPSLFSTYITRNFLAGVCLIAFYGLGARLLGVIAMPRLNLREFADGTHIPCRASIGVVAQFRKRDGLNPA
jgi:hypothetical protein